MIHSDNFRPTKLTGPLQGQKSLFRVTLHQPRDASDQSPESVYHSRRPHRKSRAGCVTCKQRKVKCDETKPYCVRCQKHGATCVYETRQPQYPRSKNIISQFMGKTPSLMRLDSRAYSMALIEVSSKIDELLKQDPRDVRVSQNLRALHHFHEATTGTTPFLMHAIIATATSHLRHVLPDNTPYKLVEAHHWQQAISQYSETIANGVGPSNMDPLFSACLLMTAHSFNLQTFHPRSSFVFSDDPDALNWLFLQSGLRHLLGLSGPWLCLSIWWDMFKQSRDENPLFEDHRQGREGLHPKFVELCGIQDDTCEETNPYHWPLRMLTPILPLERSAKSLSQYTSFMGRLLPDYMKMLQQRDPPALIILSWWLALMYSTKIWWMETRVQSEVVAICMYLEDSEDPLVLELLEFPAQTCGYLLKHVQEGMSYGVDS
ncbi:hypothetical protein FE257_010901 [Aspergillus nanangensis]|uniref:Zn(2)-C6 fungal-type domain-containing protein n=1 Tax=Aspergillus nanangensis TaxID=2582783 RepID=A0AAD4CVQ4_ASPNN|nr:hypothetical protein FE257_010901 [Aspergillus nanangensis]